MLIRLARLGLLCLVASACYAGTILFSTDGTESPSYTSGSFYSAAGRSSSRDAIGFEFTPAVSGTVAALRIPIRSFGTGDAQASADARFLVHTYDSSGLLDLIGAFAPSSIDPASTYRYYEITPLAPFALAAGQQYMLVLAPDYNLATTYFSLGFAPLPRRGMQYRAHYQLNDSKVETVSSHLTTNQRLPAFAITGTPSLRADAAAPEPTTGVLTAAGVCALCWLVRRRSAHNS